MPTTLTDDNIKNLTKEQKALLLIMSGTLSPEQTKGLSDALHMGQAMHNQPVAKVLDNTPYNGSAPEGSSPEGFSYNPPQGSILREHGNPTSGHSAAGMLLGAASGSRYGGVPGALMGLATGAGAETNGDLAAIVATGLLPAGASKLKDLLKLKPGNGGRFVGALKGAAAGTAIGGIGQEAKSLVDKGKFSMPDPLATALATTLGTVAGAAGARPAGALTAEEEQAANSAKAIADHQAQARQYEEQIASHKNLEQKTIRRVAEANDAHVDAKAELKDATNALKTAEQTAGEGQRQDFLNGQNRHNANIARKKIDLRNAQEAQDDAEAAVAAHQKELADKAAAAQTKAVSDINDKVVDVQNVGDKLRNGRDAIGQTVGKGSLKQGDYLAQNSTTVRNLRNAASKLKLGVNPFDFEHDPEDIAKLGRLQDTHADAYVKTKTLQEELDQLQIDKAEHKAAGKGSMVKDQGLLDDHESASAAEDAAHAKYRDLQKTLREYQDQLSDLTKTSTLHDLNTPESSDASLSLGKRLGKVAVKGGLGTLPLLPKGVRDVIADELFKQPPNITPQAPPSDAVKQLMALLSNANVGQAPVAMSSNQEPLAPGQPQE